MDWGQLAGMRCTCPPGCTTGDTWGDGPRDCHPECEPCRLMAGQHYEKPPKHNKKKTAAKEAA